MIAGGEVLNAYLNGNSVVLLHREHDGRISRTHASAEYAMFLRTGDLSEEMSRAISRSSFVRAFKVEKGWTRIHWADQFIRDAMCFGKRGGPSSPIVEAGIQTFEGDVSPLRRCFVDRDVTLQRPRRAYLDIETDSRVSFSRKEDMRILSWALADDNGASLSGLLPEDTHHAERDLLYSLFNALENYDQVLAWNGDGFDFPVIFARLDQRQCRVDPRRWLWLDHLALYKKLNVASESGDEKASMKLDSVARTVLNEGKDPFDGSKTWEAWNAGGEDRDRLLRYNVQDTALLPRIEAKTGFIDLFQSICEVCRVLPETSSLQSTVQMDGYMLRLGAQRNIHFPTRRFRDQAPEQFKGAFVMQPKTRGISRDVHVADFAALYPSIILSWNMSPETKADIPVNGPIPETFNRAPLTGQGFSNTIEGILPSALRELIAKRKHHNDLKASLPPGTLEWKDSDRKSTAYKVVANSFYGVVGSPFSRYFDKGIAESVTQCGVWLIRHTIHEAERRALEVIYGDTDSIFVQGTTATEFASFVEWCNARLYPDLMATAGCTRNEIKLVYEKQFERIVIVASKRYAGRYAHYKGKAATQDSKPEIKGLEYKRGDTTLLARRLQADAIDLLMGGEERLEVFRALLDRTIEHIMHDSLPPEEVILSKGLSKPLKEYIVKRKKDGTLAADLPHVQVARAMQKQGRDVGEGTRIEYFVSDGEPSKNLVVRPAGEYTGTEADRYYLWENLVYPPTQRLLQAAFPDADWIASLERLRPPKIRARKGRPETGQLAMSISPSLSSIKFEARESWGTTYIDRLREILVRHPGPHSSELWIALDTGAIVVLNLNTLIAPTDALARAVDELRHLYLLMENSPCREG